MTLALQVAVNQSGQPVRPTRSVSGENEHGGIHLIDVQGFSFSDPNLQYRGAQRQQ